MREKGNLAGKFVCSADKTLYKAGKSDPEGRSIPLRGRPLGIKRARSAWDLVCGFYGDWRFAASSSRVSLSVLGSRAWRPRALRPRNPPIPLRCAATAGSKPRPSAPISSAGPGGHLTAEQENEGLKALIATGLFQDVRTEHAGGRLVVTVIENPVINRVAFEGNKKAKDEQLKAEVQSKPRGTLSRPTVQADVQRIIEIYHRNGRFDVRVDPKIIELPNNRVDLVFEINEGEKTGVKEIRFVGTHAYSNGRLKDVIKTSESNWLSFLQTTDIYDPDRVEADRDLLRRFYLKHGYADVRIVSAVGEYDPAKKGFIVTFTIDEGSQYRVGTVDVISNVHAIDPATLRGSLKMGAGSVYNADLVEKSVEAMTIEAAKRGYAFANVRPRGDRDYDKKIINLTFVRRRRRARLYRAHQHSRQYANPRLRHPPRIRSRRGRRL